MSLEHYDDGSELEKSWKLPAETIPSELRARLHPWIAGFIGLDPEAARLRLAKRWGSITIPELQCLRDRLATFSVDGIVDFEDGGVITGLRPGSTGDRVGDRWYLPAPLEADYVTRRFEALRFNPPNGVVEFFDAFGGLAENTEASGSFRYTEAFWPIFADDDSSIYLYHRPWSEWIYKFPEWHGSLMLYFALNGSVVLLQRDGSVGWWIFSEARVQKIADSFPEFVVHYSEHWETSWPFDPYRNPKKPDRTSRSTTTA